MRMYVDATWHDQAPRGIHHLGALLLQVLADGRDLPPLEQQISLVGIRAGDDCSVL